MATHIKLISMRLLGQGIAFWKLR